MAKTKQRKADDVSALVATIKESKAVVFANIQGLTVAELQELKKQGKTQGMTGTMAKKTLLKRAFDEVRIAADPDTFQGGIGVFASSVDEIAPAKAVVDYAKSHPIVTIFGAIFEGAFVGVDAVKRLAAIPSKQELLAKLVGSMNAPMSGFVNVLAGPMRGLVGALNAIAKKN